MSRFQVYSPFFDDDGLLNEFKMMWALKDRFPLHYIVFKQTACHIPHEVRGHAPLCSCPAKFAPRPTRVRPTRGPAPRPTRAPPDFACVQANCEQLFSTAGNLSDPNMDTEYLGILTSVIKNKASFDPKLDAILDKYYAKFHDKNEGTPSTAPRPLHEYNEY